jgi:hypothetical protein
MGYYIQTDGVVGKAQYLVSKMGGTRTSCPASFDDIPAGKALIVIVDNGPFEAAGLIFSRAELTDFSEPDGRFKEWVLLDRDVAHTAAGYHRRTND